MPDEEQRKAVRIDGGAPVALTPEELERLVNATQAQVVSLKEELAAAMKSNDSKTAIEQLRTDLNAAIEKLKSLEHKPKAGEGSAGFFSLVEPDGE